MPRRWTDLDSDEHRLPQGFRRIGYDADERRYYFRDGDGRAWRSEPGNEYGTLTPVEPEPPVTIPRQPPPPYSKDPVDPPPKEPTSASRLFTDILSSHQITSASSSVPKRSHTISIPSVTSLKRSSTTAASFIRSRGKRFTGPGHTPGPSHDDDSQRSTDVVNHRRSASVTIRRSATTTVAYMRGMMKPGAGAVDINSRPPQEAERDNRR